MQKKKWTVLPDIIKIFDIWQFHNKIFDVIQILYNKYFIMMTYNNVVFMRTWMKTTASPEWGLLSIAIASSVSIDWGTKLMKQPWWFLLPSISTSLVPFLLCCGYFCVSSPGNQQWSAWATVMFPSGSALTELICLTSGCRFFRSETYNSSLDKILFG